MVTPEIQSKVNQLWDQFLSAGLRDPIVTIEQITYLLYFKWLDVTDQQNIVSATGSGKEYTSIFQGAFRSKRPGEALDVTINKEHLRWSRIFSLKGTDKLKHMANNVFLFMQQLNTRTYPFSKHMDGATFLIPKAEVLDKAMGLIDDIYHIPDENKVRGQLASFRTTLGAAYEYLLTDFNQYKAYFRTPLHLSRFVTELVQLKAEDRICDPASGSGSFLVSAFQSILAKTFPSLPVTEDDNGFFYLGGSTMYTTVLSDNRLRNTITGFDINPSFVKFATMNLLLHDVPDFRIEMLNSLSSQFDEQEGDKKYTVVISNPPFGGDVSDTNLGSLQLKSGKRNLAFLDRIMLLLEVGGRAGIIVHDDMLSDTGSQFAELRKLLLLTCQLEAVISLPEGVFNPYTPIKTSVLLFTKKRTKLPRNTEPSAFATQRIWYYELASDGYTLDNDRKPLNNKPLPPAIQAFQNALLPPGKAAFETGSQFFVDVSEVIDNEFDLSFSRYKETVYSDVKYTPPKELMASILRLEVQVMRELKSLNQMIQ
jgi:type I restriction enzyme M protein